MKGVDVSSVNEHLAFQFNVEGDGEGIFYIEISEEGLLVEPYDYQDNDGVFIVTAEVLFDIMEKKKDMAQALEVGEYQLEGNYEKMLVLKQVIESKKATVKKTTAKKTTSATKKTTAATKKATAATKKTTTATKKTTAAAKKTTTPAKKKTTAKSVAEIK